MDNYNIYAGLGGKFGGADFIGQRFAVTYTHALDVAREEAEQLFDVMSGTRGIPSFDDFYAVALKEIDEEDFDSVESYKDAITNYAEELYEDEKSGLIEFHIELIEEDDSEDDWEEDEEYMDEE